MSIHTSRGTARFVSTSRLSILCGLLAIASSTIDAFAYVIKPKPRDLVLKNIKKIYHQTYESQTYEVQYNIFKILNYT